VNTSHGSLLQKFKLPVIASAVTAVSILAAPSVGAIGLGETDLSVTSAASSGAGSNNTTLRVITADKLENIGVGVTNNTQSKAVSSKNTAMVETTEYLKNIDGTLTSESKTKNGNTNQVAGGITSQDYLQDVLGSGQVSTIGQNGSSSLLGVSGAVQDYANALDLNAKSATTDGKNTSSQLIHFGFEE
jgi:hypothetical protein